MAIMTEVGERLELDGMHYGADTSGCPIKCIPDLIRKRAYQLFEARVAVHRLSDTSRLSFAQRLRKKPRDSISSS